MAKTASKPTKLIRECLRCGLKTQHTRPEDIPKHCRSCGTASFSVRAGKLKRCGAILHYEQFANMRVFTQETGQGRAYNWRCPECGATGVNNGRTLTCQAMIEVE